MGRKKSKKADFQKVKLKVGRSLPRGLNVTQTKFKTKKIKVPEQYKPETSEPRIHRHQTIEDLMKKAQHTGVSVRYESFLNIVKLLDSHKELIEPNLSSLLQISFSGIHDDTSSVRQEALRICKLILENVLEVKISAHSSVLLPHLCCAMTSIQHAVRIDSLQALDLCLEKVPTVITSSEKILKNLVSQVSFEKNQLISSKSGFQVSKMSLKTASERLKSQNWRANVLCSLAKFLKVINFNLTKEETGYIWPSFFSPIKFPGMDVKMAEFADLIHYISELMPILFSIWIEAAPSPYVKSESGEIICADAAHVMNNVLQVIRLVCEWMKNTDEKNKNTDLITWFNGRYRKQIFGRLMVWFPYSQRVPLGRKNSPIETEVSCLTVNLAICDVFSMMPSATLSTSGNLYQQVSDYLLHVINRGNTGGVASVSIIVKILKNLLTTSEFESFKPHLNGLLKHYKELEIGRKEREIFLDFIIELICDIRNKETTENMPMMEHLSRSLIQDLFKMHQTKHMDKHTLAVVKQLNVIGFPPFLNELQENKDILLELIQNEEIEMQRAAICLISRLGHIPVEYFCKLAKVIINSAIELKIISQLLQTLTIGLRQPLHIPAYTGKDYANFLFCVAVGIFMHESDTYMNLGLTEQDRYRDIIPFHISEYTVVPSCTLQRQFDITKVAVRELMNFSDRKQMAQCIHAYVVQFATHHASFPVHSAAALLLMEYEAFKVGQMPDDMDCILCITEITIATFMYQIAWEHNRDPEEIPSGSVFGILLTVVKTLKNMRHVCEVISQRVREISHMKEAECIGGLMLLTLRKHLLLPEDLNELLRVLQEIHERFGDEILNEPWWISINHEINLPPYSNA